PRISRTKPMPGVDSPLPDGLPPWLAAFVAEAQRETDVLRDNGAEQAAAARVALLRKLIAAAQLYFDTELDAAEAASETGRCEETIRRAVRDGSIPDRGANPVDRPVTPARHRWGANLVNCARFTICIDSPYDEGAHPGCHDGCHAHWPAFTGSRSSGRYSSRRRRSKNCERYRSASASRMRT